MVSKEKMYPCFHITGSKELDLPDSGTMEIEFRKKSESERKNDDGSETYECCIEVRKILEAEGEEGPEAPAKRDTSAEEALDKLAEALNRKRTANESGGD